MIFRYLFIQKIFCLCNSKFHSISIRYSIQQHPVVRVRFAPSPTGFLHIGGLRTALYNYLFAKSHQNGKFIVRIEDTDQSRVVPGATKHLLSILQWIGIVPDESCLQCGKCGPYVQSQRLHLYTIHANVLIDNGAAYRCFCSPQRLKLLKRDQKLRQETSKYDNRCRHLSQTEISDNLAAEKPYVIRLKMDGNTPAVNDLLFGEIKHSMETEGDPVLLKSDGFPTYHLANVVDDHLMGITHVIRGKEWLVSTPKHLLIYKAFGWQPPEFLHLPLLVNSDGTKLSKRQNDIHVEELKKKGYSPSSLINFMLYCGSGFPDIKFPLFGTSSTHLLERLAAAFQPKKLLQSNALVNFAKLEYFSQAYISHLLEKGSATKQNDVICELFDMVLKKYGNQCLFIRGKFTPNEVKSYLAKVLALRKKHIVILNDLLTSDYDFLWNRPASVSVNPIFKESLNDILTYVENFSWNSFDTTLFNKRIKMVAESHNLKYPQKMQFLRTCLIGRKEGPSVADIMILLGKNETVCRLVETKQLFIQ